MVAVLKGGTKASKDGVDEDESVELFGYFVDGCS